MNGTSLFSAIEPGAIDFFRLEEEAAANTSWSSPRKGGYEVQPSLEQECAWRSQGWGDFTKSQSNPLQFFSIDEYEQKANESLDQPADEVALNFFSGVEEPTNSRGEIGQSPAPSINTLQPRSPKKICRTDRELKHPCPLCLKRFATPQGLAGHQVSHVPKDPENGQHVCKICNRKFASAQAVGGHMGKHREEGCVLPRFPRTGVTLVAAEGMHQCAVCLKVFASGQALGGHISLMKHKIGGTTPLPVTLGLLPSESQAEGISTTDGMPKLDSPQSPREDSTTSLKDTVDLISSPKRKKRSSAATALYICEVCGQSFANGQALGGHRGKHNRVSVLARGVVLGPGNEMGVVNKLPELPNSFQDFLRDGFAVLATEQLDAEQLESASWQCSVDRALCMYKDGLMEVNLGQEETLGV